MRKRERFQISVISFYLKNDKEKGKLNPNQQKKKITKNRHKSMK